MSVLPVKYALTCAEKTPQPDHPLARLRAANGWSYGTVARLIARRAREMGVASMAAQRQKIWRWEHRGVTPDRISQLALARELGVPEDEVLAHPWPTWLPELQPSPCTREIAALRRILTQVRDKLRAGDNAAAAALTESALAETGLTDAGLLGLPTVPGGQGPGEQSTGVRPEKPSDRDERPGQDAHAQHGHGREPGGRTRATSQAGSGTRTGSPPSTKRNGRVGNSVGALSPQRLPSPTTQGDNAVQAGKPTHIRSGAPAHTPSPRLRPVAGRADDAVHALSRTERVENAVRTIRAGLLGSPVLGRPVRRQPARQGPATETARSSGWAVTADTSSSARDADGGARDAHIRDGCVADESCRDRFSARGGRASGCRGGPTRMADPPRLPPGIPRQRTGGPDGHR